MSELEPPLKLILSTCQEILVNKSLQDFMAVVLQLGNVLNTVRLTFNAYNLALSIKTCLNSVEQLRWKRGRIQTKCPPEADRFTCQQASHDSPSLHR